MHTHTHTHREKHTEKERESVRERVREGKDGKEGERTCEIDINAEKNSEW